MLALTLAVLMSQSACGSPPGRADAWWSSSEIRDLDGKLLRLNPRWLVLVFLDPECPVANAYVPVLNEIAREFASENILLLGVHCDPSAQAGSLRIHVGEYDIRFPVCQDRNQHLRRLANAAYASEVAVTDPAGKVLYRGRIDDRVGRAGAMRPKATRNDLQYVLKKLCAGKEGPFENHAGFGCPLPRPDSGR